MPKKEKEDYDAPDKCIGHVTSAYKTLEEANRKYKKRFDNLYKAWGDFTHRPDYKWQSKAFYAKCFENVGTIFSRIWNKDISIKLSDITGKNPNKAHKAELLLNHQREIGRYRKADAVTIKNGLITGKGFHKISWKMQTEVETNEKNGEIIEKKKIKYEYPSVQPLDPRNVFIDPEFVSENPIQDAPCVIVRDLLSKKELEKEGIYDLENIPEFDVEDAGKISSVERKKLLGDQNMKPLYVEVIEYWGQYKDEDDDDYGEYVIVIANRKKVIRKEINPFGFRPIADFSVDEDPTSFWSKGIVEPIAGLQDEYNFIINGLADNLLLAQLGMWFVDPNSNIDTNDIAIEPGSINSGNPSDLQRVDFPVPSIMGQVQVLDRINTDMQNIIGATDYAKGSEAAANDTATGIAILSENANIRFQTILENWKVTYERIARMMIQMDKIYLDKKVMVQPKDKPVNLDRNEYKSIKDNWRGVYVDYIEITKDDLDDFYVTVEIAGDGSSTIETQKAKADIIGQMAQENPDLFDPIAVIKKRLQAIEVMDVDDLLAGEKEDPNKVGKRLQDAMDEYEQTQDPMKLEEVKQLYAELEQQQTQQQAGGQGDTGATQSQPAMGQPMQPPQGANI